MSSESMSAGNVALGMMAFVIAWANVLFAAKVMALVANWFLIGLLPWGVPTFGHFVGILLLRSVWAIGATSNDTKRTAEQLFNLVIVQFISLAIALGACWVIHLVVN